MIKDNESFNNTVSENSVFLEELREKIPNYLEVMFMTKKEI